MKRALIIFIFVLLSLPSLAGADDVSLITGRETVSCPSAIQLFFTAETVVIHSPECAFPKGTLLARDLQRSQLFLIVDRRGSAEPLEYTPLYTHYGFHLAAVATPEALPEHHELTWWPITGDQVVTSEPEGEKLDPDPAVEEFLANLSEDTYTQYLSDLSVDLPTRYTWTNEKLEARDLIAQHFADMGYKVLTPEFDNYPFGCDDVTGYNVIGIKSGAVRPDEYYLVCAHYDSISPQFCTNAPGSNDNASGAAAVMELARIFAAVETEASLLFIAFDAEELGLYGSKRFANFLVGQGLDDRLKGFVNLDMISFYKNNYGVLMEGARLNDAQKRALQEAAALTQLYTELKVVSTFFYSSSDHVPFLDKGIPGLLMIELDTIWYPQYHTVNDVFELQKIDFGIDVTKATGAVLATWAGLIPVVSDDDTGDDDTVDDDIGNDDLDDDDTSLDDDVISDDDVADDDEDEEEDDSCGC